MNLSTLRNITQNALRPKMLPEMLRKITLRFTEVTDEKQLDQFVENCRLNHTNAKQWAEAIDAKLWAEAVEFADNQTEYSEKILAEIPVQMGGGGFYALLYFITRVCKPNVVVETGVAAGFSSRAFLTAIKKNKNGKLVSSDFPYFRIENPEKYIGILVEDELRSQWDLVVGSDKDNLPKIANMLSEINILHYDSDKSVAGRNFALDCFEDKFTTNSVTLFDDIQDNLHFNEYVKNKQHLIFEFNGKYVGLIPNKQLK